MTGLAKKLNIKEQKTGLLVRLPEELADLPKTLAEESHLQWTYKANDQADFVLCFIQKEEEVEDFCKNTYPGLAKEALLWMAYPKKSSKRYQSTIHRDSGWEPLGQLELEPVRQISLNEDWSALRFRHVDQIQSLSRRKSMAISQKGKARGR